MLLGKIEPVAIARAVVTRANGKREVYYSHERVPFWDVRRWLKLRAHLRWMRAEDRKAGL